MQNGNSGKSGRQSFADDALDFTAKIIAKWVRSIVPSGRRSMAVILPVDVCKAAGVQPGNSSVSVYQLQNGDDGRGSSRYLDFHIRITVDPSRADSAAAATTNAK